MIIMSQKWNPSSFCGMGLQVNSAHGWIRKPSTGESWQLVKSRWWPVQARVSGIKRVGLMTQCWVSGEAGDQDPEGS